MLATLNTDTKLAPPPIIDTVKYQESVAWKMHYEMFQRSLLVVCYNEAHMIKRKVWLITNRTFISVVSA